MQSPIQKCRVHPQDLDTHTHNLLSFPSAYVHVSTQSKLWLSYSYCEEETGIHGEGREKLPFRDQLSPLSRTPFLWLLSCASNISSHSFGISNRTLQHPHPQSWMGGGEKERSKGFQESQWISRRMAFFPLGTENKAVPSLSLSGRQTTRWAGFLHLAQSMGWDTIPRPLKGESSLKWEGVESLWDTRGGWF